MITQETIEEVKSRSSILEVIGESVQLKRNGSRFVGLCPFHNENTPSFSVNDSGYFHCFGCGESGNVLTFVMKMMGMSFPEAVEYLGNRFGVEIRHESKQQRRGDFAKRRELMEVNSLAGRFYIDQLQQNYLSVKDYLDSRGLDEATIKEFSIGFAPLEWRKLVEYLRSKGVSDELMLASGLVRRGSKGDIYDLFRGRLIFPILIAKGQVAAFGARLIPTLVSEEDAKRSPKYLNSPETLIYKKSQVLYALWKAQQAIRKMGEVVITEGYLDVIGLYQADYQNAVATCGTALTSQHVKRLARVARRALVVFDGDRAGRIAAGKSFETFLNSGLDAKALFLPEGEDPHSFSQKYGEEIKEQLTRCKTQSLLASYIDMLVSQFGDEPLGAAAKGSLCRSIAEVLRKVENSVERAELIKEAAFQLSVSEKDLENEISREGHGVVKSQKSVSDESLSNREETQSDSSSIVALSELPAIDREILTVVMALREPYASEVLANSDLCFSLHKSTRQFIEGLRELLSIPNLNEGELRDQIVGFLKRFGKSWIAHWKLSHDLNQSEGTDLNRSFEDCKLSLKRAGLKRALSELDRAILEEGDERQKGELVRERIRLERQIRESSSVSRA